MQPAKGKKPKRGDIVELRMESLVYGGRALGRLDGYVVFVAYAAPGELVRAQITKRKSSHAEADLVEVLEASPERLDPPCPLFTRCGGCWWQHVPIALQEDAKRQIVEDALRPIRDLNRGEINIEHPVESPLPYHYRNKMEFTFGCEGEGEPLKLGFHLPGNWKHILDVERCWLHPEPFNAILEAARAEGERQGLSAWNPTKHEGMLRHLVVRWSEYEQRAILAILTGEKAGFDFAAFSRAISDACPQVKGILWGINSTVSDVARAREVMEEWGDLTLEERLGDLRFKVSIASFFQTNTRGAVELYKVAHDYLGLSGMENLLDAYCGTGTIGIFCASDAKRVYGIELVREAIWDARENAQLNGLNNCTFVSGDMGQTLPAVLNTVEGFIDRLVVDPPRGGMDKRALGHLVNLQAPVLVYVSCNPSTMTRDLKTVIEAGYRVEKVRPVDMFPQTYHVECVARCVLDR